MRLAYFDCFSGISGDMALGALVDLGVPVDWLAAQIRKIPLKGVALRSEAVSKHQLAATKIHVDVEETDAVRAWADIRELLAAAGLPEVIRRRSLAVFSRLAEVEAGIHGCKVEAVHFHEIGGADALVDVVGTVAGLAHLKIDRVVCSPLPLGRGFTNSRHGRIPLPAPATADLLKGIPVCGAGVDAELVTPTGAALMAELADGFGTLPAMQFTQIGYGAGSADLDDRPNLLRVFVGRHAAGHYPAQAESVTVLEAAVDDMNPEMFGFLMERLFSEGALDVCWTPAQMKKNRPGTKVEVICAPEAAETVLTALLAESTSTGVRYRTEERRVLPRRPITLQTPFGPVLAKEIQMPDGSVRRTPEYEACRKAAEQHRVPIWRIYEAVASAGARSTGAATGDVDPDSV